MNREPDGQEEARQIRRTEDSSQHLLDSDIDPDTRPQGDTDGIEPIRVNRNNGSTRVGVIGRGERATGEMLRQLISEYRNQLAIKRQEIESLATRVQELESLQEELGQDVETKDSE
nr:hypothetical protein [Nostoc sp. LEGE 06077]